MFHMERKNKENFPINSESNSVSMTLSKYFARTYQSLFDFVSAFQGYRYLF